MVDEKLAEYRKRAEAKRVIKKVSFNRETERDILEIANNLDFSQWVKEKIREDFKNQLD
ncbi:hypothetical protein KCG54_02025 [Neisseria subflava]|jgi:hypothetical protein|uniref:Uncharacterized protein n=1 Tax=Neisseria subflava TaxID=28449 RepID=A0A9X9N1S6_NEISU|nr:hypothetical protein [Neisseria subflava]UTG70145.1 hypothetical protein KCG54_02025 [Neisseria subflava]DAK33430.1 MAG TPA: protein of unknown function (DUF3950) [Caudoviricetes sp.]